MRRWPRRLDAWPAGHPRDYATAGCSCSARARRCDVSSIERRNIMLMRFDPFREMETMNQLLGRQSGRAPQVAIPMDAYREGDRFIVNFDLPGVDPDSVDLTVEKNVLTIRAERQWQPGNENEVLVAERPPGPFSRQLFLGDALDTQQVQAIYHNGVLTLTIPVAEQAKPRKVAINSAEVDSEAIPAKVTVGANSGT